jgi:hypothetical protein
MRPNFERSSSFDAAPALRRASARSGASCLLVMLGCSSMQAEVGSDPPSTPDGGDGGPSFLDRAVGTADARADVSEGASDAAAVGLCDSLAPIRLYYWNVAAGASSSQVNYIVKVENATGAPVPMSSLKVRYYFTDELAPPATIDIYYTDTCCSNKITDFNGDVLTKLQTIVPRPNANAYLEIAFAAAVGSLSSGDAVQVELGFHDPGYARNLTQTNDYSYGAAAIGTQAQWNDCPGASCEAKFRTCALTVHRDDVLVWGTPP